jgi:hypothetical protein
MKPDFEMAQSFLDALYGGFPGETIEFRLLKGKHGEFQPIRKFTTLPVADSILRGLERANQAGYNIYFGVATRKEAKPWYIPAVWIDIDFKDLKPTLLAVEPLTILRLCSEKLSPSLIVRSGHGLHAYWLTIAGAENHHRIKEVNRKLAKRFGGDAVTDLARILRLPGFYNMKDLENPQFCQVSNNVEWGIIRRWELSELEDWLNEVPVPILDEKLEKLIRFGAPVGKRSEADFAVMIGMLRKGFSEEEIRRAFQSGRIGDKAREKGVYRNDYLTRTLQAAKRRLKGEGNGY